MFRSILCSTFALAMVLNANPNWTPVHVRVQVEYISCDAETLKQALNTPKPYSLLLKKLTTKEASHYNTEIITCRSGETAVAESILEFIYPTEYEPSSHLHAIAAGYPQINFARYFWRPEPFVAFETRNTGHTLEVQPLISNNGFIDLRFAPEDVQLERIELLTPHQGQWGKADQKYPFFSSHRTNTGVPLFPGEPLLTSVYYPKTTSGKSDSSRPILLFVSADIVPVL